MRKRQRKRAAYMISAVAESYGIHPQTLRLYERQGLLKPSRTEGNTRLYTEEDIERLEVILSLTRDMGVNLAGVEIVLNMREKMERMQKQMREFVDLVQREMANAPASQGNIQHAIVRVIPRSVAPDLVKKR
jgi:MerR family transcriptional regulator/heat shock protein HspR